MTRQLVWALLCCLAACCGSAADAPSAPVGRPRHIPPQGLLADDRGELAGPTAAAASLKE